ncbi:MAG: hypothetical protein V4577_04480 [Bacteroidota bacterium]
MNSDQTTYAFTARASGAMAEFAHLTLYNGYLDTVLKGYGRLDARLAPGLYKLVVVQGEQMIEQSIRVDKPTETVVPLTASASSVPANGLGNMHEYYSEPFKDHAFVPTTAAGDPGSPESLFLFFRYPDQNAFTRYNPLKESLGTGFILLDRERKRLCSLEGGDIREELTYYGWLALHIRLTPGTYYLYYNGRQADKELKLPALPAREIPITVFAHWQTQCFMTFGSGPAFRSWFVALRKTSLRRFDYRPEDNNLYDIEGLLQKFNNGIFYLPDNIITQLAYGKWENPILGLLAAYAYFQSGKHDRDDLFRMVVANSARLLGESPDYAALTIAAGSYLPGLQLPFQRLREPAMFLTGMRAVISAGGNRIEEGSLAEQVVDKLFSDMFWTSYTPVSRFRVSQPKLLIRNTGPSRGLRADTLSQPVTTAFKGMAGDGNRISKTISAKKASPAPRKPAVLRSWVASSLMDLLLHPGAARLPLHELAVALHVTPNILEQAVTAIQENEQAISAYIQGKEKDPDWKAFSKENMERLKQIQKGNPGMAAG